MSGVNHSDGPLDGGHVRHKAESNVQIFDENGSLNTTLLDRKKQGLAETAPVSNGDKIAASFKMAAKAVGGLVATAVATALWIVLVPIGSSMFLKAWHEDVREVDELFGDNRWSQDKIENVGNWGLVIALGPLSVVSATVNSIYSDWEANFNK